VTVELDAAAWQRPTGAGELLRTYVDDGVIETPDVQVAQRLTTLCGETDERVSLAIALAVRALRGGSVCVDLSSADLADLGAEAGQTAGQSQAPPRARAKQERLSSAALSRQGRCMNIGLLFRSNRRRSKSQVVEYR